MVPAQRVYFLLISGIAIAPILSILVGNSVSIAITLIFDVLVLGLMVVDGRRGRRHRVLISRELPLRFSIGRDNPVTLTVRNSKTTAIIQIRDYYPREFGASTPEVKAIIPANTVQELSYTVHPTHRGEYPWGNIQVRQLGLWGLAWDDWQLPQSCQVKVYPDLLGLRSLSIRLTLQSSGSIRKVQQMGIGTEFAELRNYRSGDDLRFIDWKATARRAHSNTGPIGEGIRTRTRANLINFARPG